MVTDRMMTNLTPRNGRPLITLSITTAPIGPTPDGATTRTRTGKKTNHYWGNKMNTRKNRPEAFHARALHDYAEQLAVAVQMLADLEGYQRGVSEAQVAA